MVAGPQLRLRAGRRGTSGHVQALAVLVLDIDEVGPVRLEGLEGEAAEGGNVCRGGMRLGRGGVGRGGGYRQREHRRACERDRGHEPAAGDPWCHVLAFLVVSSMPQTGISTDRSYYSAD